MAAQVRDGRILFLIKALVALVFLSKVSLGSFLPLPHSFAFLIYQQGLHPFVNVFLCVLFGVPLAFLGLKARGRNHLSGFYKLFVLVLIFTLTAQTLLQAYYVNPQESVTMQIGALAVSLFMVILYGMMIPSLWTLEDFLGYVQKWSGALVLISLVLWGVAGDHVFKGGRFIGVFKHIPHMVTCATVAFVFSLGTFLREEKLQHKIWSAWILAASFLAIILTGTRSATGAILLALIATIFLHKTKTNQGRIFKFGFLALMVTFTLFFGSQTYDFARALVVGQSSLGGRGVQNGVAARWEEVERGIQIFLREPWLGQGLVSKFAAGNDVSVSNYNAMKDPHNIFVSAGVVGGWPLLSLSAIALILILIGSIKSLSSHDISKRQISVYLFTHIPILVIYHIHLSIGGMADRLYWLVFGFVAVSVVRPLNDK